MAKPIARGDARVDAQDEPAANGPESAAPGIETGGAPPHPLDHA
ncbi:hypothetical protein [Xanthobacter sp. VNH20]